MISTVTFNPAVDQTVVLDEPLQDGTVQRTTEQQFDASGKGFNVSRYLTGLDVETVAIGPVGGFTGDLFPEQLDDLGVPHDLVTIPGTTRVNLNLATSDAEYKINHSGPAMDASVVDAVLVRLEAHDPDTVVVSGSLPPGLDGVDIDRIADGAWDTVVDAGGDTLRALAGDYLLCKPNREELAAATGMPTGTRDEVVAAARTLRDEGFEMVLASLGADGAVLVTADTVLHAPAVSGEIADTVGAGDGILAGFLSAYQRTGSQETALRTGIALSARVVATQGPTIPEMDGFQDDVENVDIDRI